MVTWWRRLPLLACVWVATAVLSACAPGVVVNPARTPSPQARDPRWHALPPAPLSPRHDAVSVWLDGRFFVIGGRTTPTCPPAASCVIPRRPAERDGAALDPTTNTWRAVAPAPVPVWGANVAVVET